MEDWSWVLAGILAALNIVWLVKIHMLRKAAREIGDAFADRLITDTNTLIDISSRDSSMRSLADAINVQLRGLRRIRRRFQQGDAELKNAITNISHDLRTPLTAICGYLDLLEREETREDVSRYVEIIRNRVEMLNSLTEELFQYSVILAPESNGKKEPVSVNRVLEESVAAFYAVLIERQITPVIELPGADVVRLLDERALSRVFGNLLGNAIKYSDGDLRISLSEEGVIRFSNKASRLDQVEAGRLFDRFYTVEDARSSTGLGLSIARTLVEQMGGEIWAAYGEGRLEISLSFPEGPLAPGAVLPGRKR